MENYLEPFIEELLHADDAARNKLVDLYADPAKTYLLTHAQHADTAAYALRVLSARLGKVGNTVLRGSALAGEQVIGRDINDFEWRAADGSKDAKQLAQFIENVYKELNLKGNNPLFLSVGAVRWKVPCSAEETRVVLSPLLIFPVRLIRSVSTSPVCIEFVDDDAYVNPCFLLRLRQVLGEEVAAGFPRPDGSGDEPLELAALGTGEEYFARVEEYVASCRQAGGEGTVFDFERDTVAIAQYNHGELCMYYDLRRNREKLYAHPLVRRVFTESTPEPAAECALEPDLVLPHDSVQEEMIRRVVNGESLIIKGPPGTGKTQTIANMVAALLAENKKILLSSKKLSALAEVYAKLPQPLRRFVLRMDYETEAQAAKVNPASVRRDLRDLLAARREYTQDAAAHRARDAANNERTEALTYLSWYAEKMFGESSAVGSYYDALNAYYKDPSAPAVPFASPEEAAALSQGDYAALLSAVREAGGCFAAMTGGGAHALRKCPWAGVSASDGEEAFTAASALAKEAERVRGGILALLPECGEGADALPLAEVYGAMRSVLDDAATQCVLAERGAERECEALRRALEDYRAVRGGNAQNKFALSDGAAARYLPAGGFGAAECLTNTELAAICRDRSLFYGADGAFLSEEALAALAGCAERILGREQERKAHLYNVQKLFEKQTIEREGELLSAAAAAFARYGKDAAKPKALDFKAKKYHEKLAALSFIAAPSFRETADAAAEYAAAQGCAAEADAIAEEMFRILRRRPSREQFATLFSVLAASAGQKVSVAEMLAAAERAQEPAAAVAACMRCPASYTLGELAAACRAELAKAALASACGAYALRAGIPIPAAGFADAEAFAVSVLAVHVLFALPAFRVHTAAEDVDCARRLRGADEELKKGCERLCDGLESFGARFFRNAYTETAFLTLADLKLYAKEADDRSMLASALRYGEIVRGEKNKLPLHAFFAPFEEEGPPACGFERAFEHSFCALLVAAYGKKLGLLRNGMGAAAARNLQKLSAAERAAEHANALRIEGRCMARIDAEDADFAFLAAERDPSATLRSLFKKYAREIVKLKKCFLLSPSTASVLFRPAEYESFDVVIVDEASQLEPVNLLPVLFRAKQCVIVGDEWQMPPIKHFTAKYERRIVAEDGTAETVLEPELSALTLALRNRAFRAEELVCHYRSKTEALIAFSQRAFYPYLRTFPAPVPLAEGLGFADVYVPEGRCEKGVNAAEARQVLACLRAHFAKYYDEEKGVLHASFGVVAFGEEQTEHIRRLVRADGELYQKLTRALSNFKDVPEKLAFFKTIETVQGQETEHLILSLTYGRTAEGKVVNSFGQLNRDKLGKCIFNVAVTRAQCSVTVVHSVLPEDITSENVAYIREYLALARRFAAGGREQFVSEQPPAGFVRSVAEFVVSCGVARERVVCNYGVTDGSVRMPVAVLSEDLSRAELGIWCEQPVGKKYNYLDYNMRYVETFERCGWKLHRVYAHDWADNAQAEREALAAALAKYVK